MPILLPSIKAIGFMFVKIRLHGIYFEYEHALNALLFYQ